MFKGFFIKKDPAVSPPKVCMLKLIIIAVSTMTIVNYLYVIVKELNRKASSLVTWTMGDYRYTELSYKITSLISRTCCLGSSV